MKVLFDYSGETRIRECRIIADDDRDAEHLMDVRHALIQISGAAAAVDVVDEGRDGGDEEGNGQERAALFETGGC
ncbi:MAG: hypothetical protein AB1558_02400 [Thermodesulfobacteriota bacterium]